MGLLANSITNYYAQVKYILGEVKPVEDNGFTEYESLMNAAIAKRSNAMVDLYQKYKQYKDKPPAKEAVEDVLVGLISEMCVLEDEWTKAYKVADKAKPIR